MITLLSAFNPNAFSCYSASYISPLLCSESIVADKIVSALKQEACGADPIKHTEDAAFSNTKGIASPLEKKPSQSTSSKKKNRKGGLSLFLSGALDDTPKPRLPAPVVPVTPKHEGPAWGGAKITKGPASLRDIQSEQRKTNEPVVGSWPKQKTALRTHLTHAAGHVVGTTAHMPGAEVPSVCCAECVDRMGDTVFVS